MIQIINGNYIRRTSSGVMKLGSAPSLEARQKMQNGKNTIKKWMPRRSVTRKATVTGPLVPHTNGEEV